MTADLFAKCAHGRSGCVARHRSSIRGDALEHCRRRGCNNRAARAGCADRALPDLLATDLRVSPPQRLRRTRRAGFHPIIFSAPVGKRDAAARLAREGPVPEFSSRRVEALPGPRANATAYVEARRWDAIHLNGRT